MLLHLQMDVDIAESNTFSPVSALSMHLCSTYICMYYSSN